MRCDIYQDLVADTLRSPPYPKISARVYAVVELALKEAWSIVTADRSPTAPWRTAREDSLTLMLFEVLKDTIWQQQKVPGFNNEIFSGIQREPKVRNFDGKHPDKMPDLLIEFREIPSEVRASQYGIFIECKPVDATHSVHGHYCDKGIRRFLTGDYAWAMQDALMVAYASDKRTIREHLWPHVTTTTPAPFTSSALPVPCRHSKEDSLAGQTFVTTHPREFNYLETGAAAPEITLRHLWLKH